MKTVSLVSLIFSLLIVNAHSEVLTCGPFKGIDLNDVHEDFRIVLRNANEDFWLLRQGKEPKHAKREDGMLNDGGTLRYKGQGYRILLRKSLTTVGGIHGMIYGPVLGFDDSPHWQANHNGISGTRFMTFKQYRAMIKQAQQVVAPDR